MRPIRLWGEFFLLYFALPASLLTLRRLGATVPVLPLLWAAAFPAALYLARCHGWGAKKFIGCSLTRSQTLHMLLRLLIAGGVLAGGVLVLAPEHLLDLPRRNPHLWALVMVFYPLLSVYPQGILYRGLFYARYAPLFRTERGAWLAGAAVFSFTHIVFANGWALALTFAGGLLFTRTYRRTGSLLASDLEHAVCGQWVFTLGWGRFLYHGTTQLLQSLTKSAM